MDSLSISDLEMMPYESYFVEFPPNPLPGSDDQVEMALDLPDLSKKTLRGFEAIISTDGQEFSEQQLHDLLVDSLLDQGNHPRYIEPVSCKEQVHDWSPLPSLETEPQTEPQTPPSALLSELELGAAFENTVLASLDGYSPAISQDCFFTALTAETATPSPPIQVPQLQHVSSGSACNTVPHQSTRPLFTSIIQGNDALIDEILMKKLQLQTPLMSPLPSGCQTPTHVVHRTPSLNSIFDQQTQIGSPASFASRFIPLIPTTPNNSPATPIASRSATPAHILQKSSVGKTMAVGSSSVSSSVPVTPYSMTPIGSPRNSPRQTPYPGRSRGISIKASSTAGTGTATPPTPTTPRSFPKPTMAYREMGDMPFPSTPRPYPSSNTLSLAAVQGQVSAPAAAGVLLGSSPAGTSTALLPIPIPISPSEGSRVTINFTGELDEVFKRAYEKVSLTSSRPTAMPIQNAMLAEADARAREGRPIPGIEMLDYRRTKDKEELKVIKARVKSKLQKYRDALKSDPR
mmetsp:Transcript_17982/g.29877  ORF Transcript_17982/g.29877 Transcript_17982/m.29877 type:complete len:517 (+) Transcript_17982:90-1640(+)